MRIDVLYAYYEEKAILKICKMCKVAFYTHWIENYYCITDVEFMHSCDLAGTLEVTNMVLETQLLILTARDLSVR